jgi:7,8-dihydropterin-6-yl-methyl-4-(beta-D-ribofuranosyl)aminobenzene 5'-phosphate synthase
MKLTVLLDNNTIIDHYFLGEPGVSYFIQDENINILFDVGYSDAFIRNAVKMGIPLDNLSHVILSHGHIDHTGGLYYLINKYNEALYENKKVNRPKFVAHHSTFNNKEYDNLDIGSIISEEKLSKLFNLNLSKEPLWLSDKLVFLGEIERINDFENKKSIGKTVENGELIDDYILDDSALVYKSSKGLIIITGCSHAGICNIIEYAKKICGVNEVADIIGGLHLLNPSDELLAKTIAHINENHVEVIHAAHCTDLKSKIALSKVTVVEEVGVGLVIEYD